MNRKMALAAGLGTTFVVAIPVSILTGFALGSGNLPHFVGWAVALVQLGAIATGFFVWRLAHWHSKNRSLMAVSSPS